MELRVIVWKTDDCVFKDELEKCNDLYVSGKLRSANSEFLLTDTHWRCRGIGSFNWRWKFKARYPVNIDNFGEDQLQVQIWNKNIFGTNDFLGEILIDLN